MENDFFPLEHLENMVSIHDAERVPVKSGDRKPGPYPYYGASGITDYVHEYLFDGDYVLLAEDGDNLRSQNTPIAFMARGQFWVNNHAHILKGKDGHHTDFICYALQIADVTSFISGSTRPKITQKDMRKIPIFCPPKPEQKAIAHILGSLDDKIELNRRMNVTLEAMAQALFKSWFIDFDPVIDNALAAGHPIPEPLQERAEARAALGDQHQPLPEAIRQQFPNRFVCNEDMGWVPEGWNIRSIEEMASAIGMGPFGSNIKVDTFVDKGVPIVNGQHLNETLLLEGTHCFITEEHAEKLHKSLAYPGDLVFTHRGNIGQVSLVPNSKHFNKFMVSQSQMFVRPNKKLVTSTFLIYFFKSPIGQHLLLANASQVGVPSIARPSSHLKRIRLLLPTKHCLNEFERYTQSLLESIQEKRSQIASLTNLRDTLLPKLLSGQLRIPEAEQQGADML